MPGSSRDLSLVRAAEQYCLARDLAPQYAAQIKTRIQHFSLFVGGLPCEQVRAEKINEFLASLQQFTPWTIRGYRTAILCVLGDAALGGGWAFVEPRRVRLPRLTLESPQAFSIADVASLIESAKYCVGRYPDGARKADYWPAMIAAAYDTGCRRGDLFTLPREAFNGKPFAFVQRKTRQLHVTQVRDKTVKMVEVVPGCPPLRWRLTLRAFTDEWHVLCSRAGLAGQFKWLRRTSGTLTSHEHLGHRSEDVFVRFYRDLRLRTQVCQLPPEWSE